jgi:hypothetical protein
MKKEILDTQVYTYRITNKGIISSGENYLSKIKKVLPEYIYILLKKGCKSLDIKLNNEKYTINVSDSIIPGIPYINLN